MNIVFGNRVVFFAAPDTGLALLAQMPDSCEYVSVRLMMVEAAYEAGLAGAQLVLLLSRLP